MFKPLSLWYFVMASFGNWYNSQRGSWKGLLSNHGWGKTGRRIEFLYSSIHPFNRCGGFTLPSPACQVGIMCFAVGLQKSKHIHCTQGAHCLMEKGYRQCLVWCVLEQRMEKAMAPHSSTLAWEIPWMEEPGGLQSMGALRVGHDWVTSLSLFTFMHWRRKWQLTPVFLPGGSQGWRSLVGCHLWGCTESDSTEAT